MQKRTLAKSVVSWMNLGTTIVTTRLTAALLNITRRYVAIRQHKTSQLSRIYVVLRSAGTHRILCTGCITSTILDLTVVTSCLPGLSTYSSRSSYSSCRFRWSFMSCGVYGVLSGVRSLRSTPCISTANSKKMSESFALPFRMGHSILKRDAASLHVFTHHYWLQANAVLLALDVWVPLDFHAQWRDRLQVAAVAAVHRF